jgi:hypothetical protein
MIPVILVSMVTIIGVWFVEGAGPPAKAPAVSEQKQSYSLHANIRATTFWAGEDADESNAFIDNRASAWVLKWVDAYGGIDSPTRRCGNLPCGFKPKENPFYFALPYNDLDDACKTKPSQARAPWYSGPVAQGQSIIKNRWIEIHFKNKVAYAQWEDAGPSGEDDADYVFGTARPKFMYGLDLSPAAANYLGTDGDGLVSWRFINEPAVPGGPWRATITTSAPDCAK